MLQKLKLYNGKSIPGFTEDNIKELHEQVTSEGLQGISPRYVQDKISNALVAHPEASSINPFMVLNELAHTLPGAKSSRKNASFGRLGRSFR